MVLYQVTISIDPSIFDDYLLWLKEHIKDLLLLNGFQRASILQNESKKTEVMVHYMVESREMLEEYFNQGAHKLRKAYPPKFEGKFSITRHIYDEVLSLNSSIR